VAKRPGVFISLPRVFNWVHTQGENPAAILLHWAGIETKDRIREWAKKKSPEDIIGLLDDTNPITTARIHLLELYERCRHCNPASILEIGCGWGTSGVAVGLAAPSIIAVMVDDEKEVLAADAFSLWERHGVQKAYIKSEAGEFLKSAGRFDFVFHDAGHGPHMEDEYRRCWNLTNKVLMIHDVDKLDWSKFVASLAGVGSSGVSVDRRGRKLGHVIRP
jgi:precorrin-6B methylase 2